MSSTKRINVRVKDPSVLRMCTAQVTFWTTLVGAIGLSKVWFGGSWVVDIVAAFLSFGLMVMMTRRFTGVEVDMTKTQVAAWVAAGQPDDVKAWKERANG